MRWFGPEHGFDYFVDKVQENWAAVKAKNERCGLRYGQVFMNTLADEHPSLAERIRATPRDPFHKDEVKPEVWEYCSEKWDTTSW